MIKVLHLYYDLMNLYGEYGNIEVLKRHLLDQGIEVSIDKKTINDDFKFEDYDFIYSGSGLESNEMIALKDLINRKESLLKAINDNKLILFTGNSMELLGKSINEEEALNIIDIKTTINDVRCSGDVVCRNEEFGEIVGFINKSSIIEYNNSNTLFSYIFKDENINDEAKVEGYRINNTFGTHIIGPILAKNPAFIKFFIDNLCKKENKEYKEKEYYFEEDSYNVTLNALKGRIK